MDRFQKIGLSVNNISKALDFSAKIQIEKLRLDLLNIKSKSGLLAFTSSFLARKFKVYYFF